MTVKEIIARKRDRLALNAEEIRAMVTGFVRGEVAEGQMAALLMAIVLNGMEPREIYDLTLAMADTGEQLDLSGIPGVKVDKHSTGGVGDKTTLVVAPLVAAMGIPVPKMSGRALAHTGGTIDKLEAIPGLKTDLSPRQFVSQLAEINLAIAVQTQELAPADKLIYALRDATATVESIPLIASSIMSKKLAIGADAMVLDVKAGRGAFMPDVERARELAETMVDIGARHGKHVVALVTSMEQPLGRAVGDAVELAEAVATLAGHGPDDLVELCETLAAHMLVLGGAAADLDEGRAHARQGLQSRVGLAKLRQMVVAQDGDPAVIDNPALLSRSLQQVPIRSARPGVIAGLDAREVGSALRELKEAAGRRQHACGLLLHQKVGGVLSEEETMAVLLFPSEAHAAACRAASRIRAAYHISDRASPTTDIVAAVVGA